MAYQGIGFTRATRKILESINRFSFYNYLQLFLRYSGFFVLGLIAYLHFVFNNINPDKKIITNWMLFYLGYLFLLEILHRRRFKFYNSIWFVNIRIFSNIVFISWLQYAAPLARGILVFTYIIPFMLTAIFFSRNLKTYILVYILSILGVVLSSMFDFQRSQTVLQIVSNITVLGILLINIRQVFSSVSEEVNNIMKRLQGTLDITEIINEICDGVLMITEADGVFLLIIEPDTQSYVSHKALGIKLTPSFSMTELIKQCSAIQNGKGYENGDIKNAEENYFSKFFIPTPRSILIEPLRGSHGEIIGLILIGNINPDKINFQKKSDFIQFCVSVATIIETSLMYRKARLNFSDRKSVAEELLEAEKEDIIAKVLVENTLHLINKADGTVLHYYESDVNSLIPVAGLTPTETKDLKSWIVTNINSHKQHRKHNLQMGKGIAGNALLQRKLIVSPDVRNDPFFEKHTQNDFVVSLMSAPLIDSDTKSPIGTLSVYSNQKNAFTVEDQATLRSLTEQGVISIMRLRDFEEWRLKGGILKQIFESALEINYEANENIVYEQIVNIAKRILPFGMVRLRVHNSSTDELVSVAAAGYPTDDHFKLIGVHSPLIELEKFLKEEYRVDMSYLIPSSALGWKEYAEKYLYIPNVEKNDTTSWDNYDAFFTPLISPEDGSLIGYLAWDKPESNLTPSKKIIEAVGSFANMASWSIDLMRSSHRYRKLAEQRSFSKSFIASTTAKLAATSDINVMGEIAVNIGQERLNTEACSLYLVDGNELELSHSTYLKNTHYIGRRKKIKAESKGGLSCWVAATLKPLYFNSEIEYQDHTAWAHETDQLKYLKSGVCENILLVPIMSHAENCLGVLSFENKNNNGAIANFSNHDVETAISLAEELGLPLGLAEQLKNVKTLEQQMLEDDLHELKNHYYYGIHALIDTALFWLDKEDFKKAKERLNLLDHHSNTILNELYSLHNSVQSESKYYQIENFREALELLADNLLTLLVNFDANKRERIKIEYEKNIHVPPLLRYAFIRIAAGSLMNSIKHSGFDTNSNITIKIIVKQKDGRIHLIIQDNGQGVNKIQPGYGIRRMRALVRSIKSKGFDTKFSIVSSDKSGTEVKLISSPDSDGV